MDGKREKQTSFLVFVVCMGQDIFDNSWHFEMEAVNKRTEHKDAIFFIYCVCVCLDDHLEF